MKRLSPKQRTRHRRLMHLRGRKSILRVARLRELLSTGLLHHSHRDERDAVALEASSELIAAPSCLSFKDAYFADTAVFFQKLREASSSTASKIYVDLRACTDIGAEAMLPIHAEVFRLRAIRGADFVSGLMPKNQDVIRNLKVMHLWEVLSGPSGQLPKHDAETDHLVAIETGTSLDGSESQRVASVFARGLKLDDANYRRVHAALNDALENISEHAYHGADPSEEKRWWVCSMSLPSEPVAYLLAYDLGVTIPRTVPENAVKNGGSYLTSLLERLGGKALADASDESFLKAAFDPTVTRRPTGKGGRGLPRMKHLADQYEGGSLLVWSGRAAAFTSKKGGEIKVKSTNECINGTFVLWRIENKSHG